MIPGPREIEEICERQRERGEGLPCFCYEQPCRTPPPPTRPPSPPPSSGDGPRQAKSVQTVTFFGPAGQAWTVTQSGDLDWNLHNEIIGFDMLRYHGYAVFYSKKGLSGSQLCVKGPPKKVT